MIAETGSIAAAGRAMDMSYRRAWRLVESLNACFRETVVETRLGGMRGGGARLTPFGAALVQRYRGMERRAGTALARDLAALEKALTDRPPAAPDPEADED
jgi:molybdate transport system regulatory protein